MLHKLSTVYATMLCVAILVSSASAQRFDHDFHHRDGFHRDGRRPAWMGINWGFARTYWSAKINDEGYPEAGTGATVIGLERVRPFSRHSEVAIYLNYLWMRSTISTLICDTCPDDLSVETNRTYFREIDLGANIQVKPFDEARNFYFGAGPLVRWGQAGKRRIDERPGVSEKAAWFGLNLLAGYRTSYERRMAVTFEPHFIFSPDEADRWQKVYAPDMLTFQMGLLWR